MEIKNISGVLNTYNKVKATTSKTKVAPSEKKTDKVEFNFARSIEAAKAAAASYVNADADAAKVESLKNSVSSGDYSVSAESIADAILMF